MMMRTDQVRALHAAGMAIGCAHGYASDPDATRSGRGARRNT
jgi:hypothetical protein